LPTERAIHFAIFTLLLIGLCAVSAWVCIYYQRELMLQIAGIALSWGVILLVLYAGFIKLEWQWWNQ
jgi:preprotein translocase subunit SecD